MMKTKEVMRSRYCIRFRISFYFIVEGQTKIPWAAKSTRRTTLPYFGLSGKSELTLPSSDNKSGNRNFNIGVCHQKRFFKLST